MACTWATYIPARRYLRWANDVLHLRLEKARCLLSSLVHFKSSVFLFFEKSNPFKKILSLSSSSYKIRLVSLKYME